MFKWFMLVWSTYPEGLRPMLAYNTTYFSGLLFLLWRLSSLSHRVHRWRTHSSSVIYVKLAPSLNHNNKQMSIHIVVQLYIRVKTCYTGILKHNYNVYNTNTKHDTTDDVKLMAYLMALYQHKQQLYTRYIHAMLINFMYRNAAFKWNDCLGNNRKKSILQRCCQKCRCGIKVLIHVQ